MDAELRLLCSQVLDIDSSDLTDDTNFFEAGGDSVTALRLVAAAQESNVSLDIEDVFNYPLLGDLVTKCRQISDSPESKNIARPVSVLDQGTVDACASACQVEPGTIEDVFPASVVQGALFGAGKAYGTYLMHWVFQICGQLDRIQLIEAWDRVQKKHQILRTRLVSVGNDLLQVVLRSGMEWQEGTDLAQHEGKSLSQPVGSGRPLFRLAIIQEGDASYFVWTAHHCGFDGTTRRMIFEHLQESLSNPLEYSQKANGTSYKELIGWSQDRPTSHSKEYWESYLEGYTPIGWVFPLSLGRVPVTTSTLCRSWTSQSLQRSKFTMATVTHAAWALALGNVSGLGDLYFTTTRSGRYAPIPGIDLVFGPMLVTVPLRTKLDKGQSLVDYLQNMQARLASMAQHERGGARAAWALVGRPQVYQSYMSWHRRGEDVLAKDLAVKTRGGSTVVLKPRRDLSTNSGVNFGLALNVFEQDNCLDFYVDWDDRLRSESDVEQLIANFVHNLDQLVGSSHLSVGDLWPGKARQWAY